MILVFDVGNTETTIGLFEGASLRGHWRIISGVDRTADEFGVLVRGLLALDGFGTDGIEGAAIGSVVPRVTDPLVAACKAFSTGPVILVDARVSLPIRVDVDEPLTVGADRLINTLAASRLFKREAIVVDMGTATTFDCITGDGVFIGGVIAPGVQTALETLVRRTSKLPATELVVPPNVIGRRTEDCIRAGVMFGQAEAIDGIVRRIKKSWPGKQEPIVIATGGLAETFRTLCEEFDRVEPHLTLVGLQMAFAHLSGADSAKRVSRSRKAR
ncbi:MAG TPA: type III pantothenate kinase [Gemmatimonadaceae bacterium]|nr:type III pantothenate kinase [Gemmatimonadaceae bacterium]